MIPNPFPGKFIVFEGIDGCGKTKQLEKTATWLGGLKLPIFTTKEPNKKGDWGSRIYQELENPKGLHKTDPFGFQTWYACDSKENLHNSVIPHLRAGCPVLSDRFRLSLCYGAEDSSDFLALMEMNQRIIGEDFIWPDLALVFDVDVDNAIARLKAKGRDTDAFEERGKLSRVIRRYQDFACAYKNCVIVDADDTEEEVFKEVQNLIKKLLKLT